MFNFVLAIFLLLSPIVIVPLNGFIARLQWYQFGVLTGSGNLMQLQFFQYGAVFLFLAALFDKPKRKFDNKYLGLLFGIYVWSVFSNPKTMENFFTILAGFAIYYLVSIYASRKKMFFWIIFSVATLNTIFAVLQYFDINLIYWRKDDIVGLMSYKTHLGIYQAIAIPITYSLNPFLALIPAVGLFLSKSATSILAMIIGMIYLLRLKLKHIIFPLIVLVIAGLQHNLVSRFLIRWVAWKEAFSLIIKNIWGYGVGTFKFIHDGVQYNDPYNLYLGITHALGIAGLIAIILFIRNSLYKNCSRELITACLILVVIGFGYSFLDYARLAGTAVVLFALLEVGKIESKKEGRFIC